MTTRPKSLDVRHGATDDVAELLAPSARTVSREDCFDEDARERGKHVGAEGSERAQLEREREHQLAPGRTDLGKPSEVTQPAPNPPGRLYYETAMTLPVDWQSFPRSFNTALA